MTLPGASIDVNWNRYSIIQKWFDNQNHLESIDIYNSEFTYKVQILWKGHKNLKKYPTFFELTELCNIKKYKEIF